MMQKFWDSAMALTSNEDEEDTRSDGSLKLASEGTDMGRSLPYPLSNPPNAFAFKIQDKKGRMHRFTCGMLLVLLIIFVVFHEMAIICGIPFSM
jgi:hypothetical protein